MEETRIIKRVGHYSIGQASPEDCKQCHNAKYATVLVDGVCLDCLLSSQLEPLVMPMLAEVLAEVDKEPELSGEIPNEIKGILLLAGFDEKHFDAIKFMLRTTVKLTKQGITKRIEELYASKHSA